MRSAFLLPMLALMPVSAMDPGDSKLAFVDVRLGLGLERGISTIDGDAHDAVFGPVGQVTVMAGDIGSARQHEDGWADDLGIVLGARAQGVRWQGRTTDGERIGLDGFGIAAVGGLGWSYSTPIHFELCASYGIGVTSDESMRELEYERNGRYRWVGGEFGTYYTWDNAFQAGIIVGYDRATIKASRTAGADPVTWRAGGMGAHVTAGYRF